MCTLEYDFQRNLLLSWQKRLFDSKVVLKKTIFPPNSYTILIHSFPFPSFIGGDIWSALQLYRAGSFQMHGISNTTMFFSTSVHNLLLSCQIFSFLMQSMYNRGRGSVNLFKSGIAGLMKFLQDFTLWLIYPTTLKENRKLTLISEYLLIQNVLIWA